DTVFPLCLAASVASARARLEACERCLRGEFAPYTQRGWLHAIVGSSRSPMRGREEARPGDSLVVMALHQFDFASLAASASAAGRACRSCEAHEQQVEATSSD